MKRSKLDRYDGGTYPALKTLLDRRTLLAGLGGVAGAAILPGCIAGPTLTNEDPPPAPTYEIQLPISPGSRTLWLGYGVMDYHVELLVRGTPIADWVEDSRAQLMSELDAALLEHDISEFAAGADFTGVEAELVQVIADAWAGEEGASSAGFLRLDLLIDYFDDDPEIDGDWA
jgi:hypothetical protein